MMLVSSSTTLLYIFVALGPCMTVAAKLPTSPYGPDWQSYFHVADKLPGVSFDLPTSYAGSLSVNRTDHADNSIFFWGFEANVGSLSAPAGDRKEEPWAIFLNGGPGRSSFNGLFNENGPLLIGPNQSLVENPHAWSKLADYFWVDQPVGVGYSTADSSGFAAGQVAVANDFANFLVNLVAVFPSLATRPFYLTGESYAGRYIPYIAKKLLSMKDSPVKLVKIAVASPALGTAAEFKTMPVLQTLETHPAIIDYDVEVYNYFQEQTRLCGLEINLTYPQKDPIPSIQVTNHGHPERRIMNSTNTGSGISGRKDFEPRDLFHEIKVRAAKSSVGAVSSRSLAARKEAHRKPMGSIDPWYGCDLFEQMVDYAVNYTWPWSESHEFDTFDIPDALNPDLPTNPAFFLNSEEVRTAIHAPKKDWVLGIDYPWGSDVGRGDPSPEVMSFMDELVKDFEASNVRVVFWVGNDDGLSPHYGTQVSIQNTTFGGIRGFTERPSTPWYNDAGDFAGITHTERGWTFAIVYGAGHQIAMQQPAAAFAFARDYIFSDAEDMVASGKDGKDSKDDKKKKNGSLRQTALPADNGIAYGHRSTEGVSTAPAATVAAFYSAAGLQPLTGTANIGSRTAGTARHTASATNVATKASGVGRTVHIGGTMSTVLLISLTMMISFIYGL